MGKIYDFFYPTKPGKGVFKEEKPASRFFVYWRILGRKLMKLILVNLMYTAMIYPLLCAATVYAIGSSQSLANFISQKGVASSLPWINIMGSATLELLSKGAMRWVVYTVITISAVIYGPLTAGYFYYLRNTAREEHAWYSDIFDKAKVNLRQGFLFGAIDILLVYSLITYLVAIPVVTGTKLSLWYGAKTIAIFISVVYFIMRYYIYTMAVTFKLSAFKILKNAIIFLFLNPLRNILTIIAALLYFVASFILPNLSIALFPIFTITIINFTGIYNSYPPIDKYMIQPALDEKKKDKKGKEESIFND